MRKELLILLLIVFSSGCVSGDEEWEAEVTRVTDGDTVEVRLENGSRKTIRLIGMDSPELGYNEPHLFDMENNKKTRDCLDRYAREATEYVSKIEGQKITVVQDSRQETTGEYGRMLAYIYGSSERSFNLMLVEKGYARVYASNFEKFEAFKDAERKARQQKKGLWGCGQS